MTYRLHKGFTLIELLVVMSIIFLLASVTLVLADQARLNARNAQRSSIVQSYKVALELAYDANGMFPRTTGLGYAGDQVCLGVYPTGTCWYGGFTPQTAVQAAVSPYVPSPSPMPELGVTPRNGLVYYSPTNDDYCLAWILEGTNKDCAPGQAISGNSGGDTYCQFERVPADHSC